MRLRYANYLVTLAPGEECQDNAFGSVCMSVRTPNSTGQPTQHLLLRLALFVFTQDILCLFLLYYDPNLDLDLRSQFY